MFDRILDTPLKSNFVLFSIVMEITEISDLYYIKPVKNLKHL